jgi:hypothetical protein
MIIARLFVTVVSVATVVTAAVTAQAQQAPPPVPRPFPGASQSTGAAPTQTETQPQAAPDPALGLPVYPASTFLETFDAGKGQQYHLYGTDAPYAEIVAYYKTTLKSGGRVIFQGPLMHQFDLGKFQEETMAYPPSVVVKDYTWNGAEGYLHIDGTKSTRYKTIIQIVPSSGR